MTGLTPDITTVRVVRHGTVELTFADGLQGEVDLLERMHGPGDCGRAYIRGFLESDGRS
jgi:hypothetical protein